MFRAAFDEWATHASTSRLTICEVPDRHHAVCRGGQRQVSIRAHGGVSDDVEVILHTCMGFRVDIVSIFCFAYFFQFLSVFVSE